MTSFRIAVVVFLGSLIGIYAVYPYPQALPALVVFGLFNGIYAWIVARVGAMVWDFIVLVKGTHR